MATATLFAQDIIVTKDAKKIDAKILEVSKTEIKYKESDNLEGPLFILPVEDIVTIIYANGKVVLYNQQDKRGNPISQANQFGSLFGNFGDGNSWSLQGRDIKGTLPKPSSDFKQEGKVVVQIRVNAEGKVISASVIGGNVSDKQVQQLAIDAAKKAKFTEGDSDTIGTITYIFKLN